MFSKLKILTQVEQEGCIEGGVLKYKRHRFGEATLGGCTNYAQGAHSFLVQATASSNLRKSAKCKSKRL